jgi:hypothetical protein
MGKSLTEIAKQVLTEGSYPSVSPDQNGTFDRDAKTMTTAKSSLRPNAGHKEGTFSNPGATPPAAPDNSVQDLGPALVKHGDVAPSSKAADKMGKDKSGSSQSRKGAVAAEKPKKQAEVMEEDVDVEGDIEISEELAEFINNMVAEGATEEEIATAIDENFEVVSENVIEEEAEEEYQVDMSEHVEALLQGEELSEEFREKAKTIFEAAVKQKVEEEVARLEAAYAEVLEEEVANIKESLTSNVDDYLNYVVEQWVQDNEVAIETGLRTELTEEFISGLRQLFAENYIDIPEEKVSVIEEMAEKISSLEEKLNEEIENNVALNKMINESKQYEVILDACDGLTDTQAEKLKSLAEGLEFTSVEEYASKINILKENYFSNSVVNENVLDNNEVSDDGRNMISEELTGPMAKYVRALGRTLPK